MRRAVLCLALTALLATMIVSAAPAAIWSQATPVAGGAGTPVATPVLVSATPIGGVTPIEADGSSLGVGIAGNAFDLVAPGTPGQVSVVAAALLSGLQEGTSVVMVHDLTGAPVGRTMISATARDANGTLVAVGDGYLPVPSQVPDGGYSLIRVLFDPRPLPEGATVEYAVSNSAPDLRVLPNSSIDLAINELSFLGDRHLSTGATPRRMTAGAAQSF